MVITKSDREQATKQLTGVLPKWSTAPEWTAAHRRMSACLLPHHGETAEQFHQFRYAYHPAMRFTDHTPMPVITRASMDSSAQHAYTMGVPVFFKDQTPCLERIKRVRSAPASSPEHKSASTTAKPHMGVNTTQIPQYLAGGWSAHGRMVSSREGNANDVMKNIQELWFPPPSNRCTTEILFTWPLSPSCIQLMHSDNWGIQRSNSEQQKAYMKVLATIVISSWMQCWGVLMGRYLHHEISGARQTWPLLLRKHETACTLYDTSTSWNQDGYLSARYSEEVYEHFTVFSKFKADRTQVAELKDIEEHTQQWLSFLTTHSLADVVFAWCIMNANFEDALKACKNMNSKRHQWFLTRHWLTHAQLRQDTDEPLTVRAEEYRVIQNTVFPLVMFPASTDDESVLLISHPVIRPGAPLFSLPIIPLQQMRGSNLEQIRQDYGNQVFLSALHSLWSLAACMTVEERDKQLFRFIINPRNTRSFFHRLLEACSIPLPASSTASQVQAANTEQLRITGLCPLYAGPRCEGRTVYVETETSQEFAKINGPGFQWISHVGDGRPLHFNGRKSYLEHVRRALDCTIDERIVPEDFQWLRNHRSFYAPDASVDLAHWLVFVNRRRHDATYYETTIKPLQKLALPVLKDPSCLGMAFVSMVMGFQPQEHSGRGAAAVLTEYNVWTALLFWVLDYTRFSRDLPVTQGKLAWFWILFCKSYHAYMTSFAAACVRWIHYGLDSIHHAPQRQEAFSRWLTAERYVTEHRLSGFSHARAEDSSALQAHITAFLQPLGDWIKDTGMSSSSVSWAMFFFLTHVIQPTPLPASYFSAPTPTGTIEALRLAYGPREPDRDVTRVLQREIAFALSAGNVLFNEHVQREWIQYSVRKREPTSMASLARFMVNMMEQCPNFMALIQQYLLAHTVDIWVKQEHPKTRKPLRMASLWCDDDDDHDNNDEGDDTDSSGMLEEKKTFDAMEITDDMLQCLLGEELQPNVVIYVRAQTNEEVDICRQLYVQLFPGDNYIIDVIALNVEPSSLMGSTQSMLPTLPSANFFWQQSCVNWMSQPRRFTPWIPLFS